MMIVRAPKTEGFVMMDKAFLENPKLSWKAKGLLAYMLSLPDSWRINVKQLIKRSGDRRDAVLSGLRELEEAGHLALPSPRQLGRFTRRSYLIFEKADHSATSGLSVSGKSGTGKPESNKNIQNKNILNNNKKAAAIYARALEQESAFSAAANLKTKTAKAEQPEAQIGKVLTERQVIAIRVLAAQLSLDTAFAEQQITRMVLSQKHYSEAGQDFNKKLNTIAKQLRSGVLKLDQECTVSAERRKEINAKIEELNIALGAKECWFKTIERCWKNQDPVRFQAASREFELYHKQHQEKLAALSAELGLKI